jgi:hypothetical protein
MLENIVNYKVFQIAEKQQKQCGTNAAQSLYMLENTVNYKVFEIAEKYKNNADKCSPETAHVRKHYKLQCF